jgi:hypothetical protein
MQELLKVDIEGWKAEIADVRQNLPKNSPSSLSPLKNG